MTFPFTPIDIGKFKVSNFARPKAEAGKQQEHSLVTKSNPVIGARANQLLHVRWPEKIWEPMKVGARQSREWRISIPTGHLSVAPRKRKNARTAVTMVSGAAYSVAGGPVAKRSSSASRVCKGWG